MTELHLAVADLDPRLHPLSKQDFDLASIDIHIDVPRVDYEKLSGDRLGESSSVIRERVQKARPANKTIFEHSKFEAGMIQYYL